MYSICCCTAGRSEEVSQQPLPANADPSLRGWLLFTDGISPSLAVREGAELALCGQAWRVGGVQADGRLLLRSETVSDDRKEAWQRAREDQAHELLKRREEDVALTGDVAKLMDAAHEVALDFAVVRCRVAHVQSLRCVP